jgi:hypothetical protein
MGQPGKDPPPASGRGHPSDYGVPARVELWKAMQQHDYRPVGWTFIDDIEHKLTAADLVHATQHAHQMPGH